MNEVAVEGGLGGPERNVSVSGSSFGTGSRDTMVTGNGAEPDVEATREDGWEVGACVEAAAGPRVGTGTWVGLKASVCTDAGARSEADDDAGAKVSV